MSTQSIPIYQTRSRPNIFDYKCFREFTKDFVEYLKETDLDFSHRRFSKSSGFKSPSILTGIISGKSGLSRQGAKKLVAGLKLGGDESKFFLKLVELANARNPAEYAVVFQQLLKDSRFSKAHPLAAAEFRYYRQWYYPAIREILLFNTLTPEEIQERLRWPVGIQEINTALNDLKELKFVSEKEGRYSSSQRLIMTPAEAPVAQLGIYQRQMLEKAHQALDELPSDRRDIRSSTMSIDKDLFPELKAYMHQVLMDVMERFESQSTKKDLVLQLNTQAFPLTRF